MDSRNNSPRNKKQQELVERLEEIRRQRTTNETSERRQSQAEKMQYEEVEPRKRNEKTQRTTTSRDSGQRKSRSRNTQTRKSSPPTRQGTDQSSQPFYRSPSNAEDSAAESPISQAEIRDEIEDRIRAADLTEAKKNTKKNYSKPLLNQLSDADSLAKAVILNEVLSKPIALRYKNR